MSLRSVFGSCFPFLFRSAETHRPSRETRHREQRRSRFLDGLLNRTPRRSPPSNPRFDRFLKAQKKAMPAARKELHAGKKTSHWMWFVFPQLAGLGTSGNSRYFGIRSLEEAREYLWTPQLRQNLDDALTALMSPGNAARGAEAILGKPDAQKLHASITLFQRAATDSEIADKLTRVRHGFFGGRSHTRTVQLLDMGDDPA